jgi:hypothetical protein
MVAHSSSFSSSWELADLAVTSGHSYTIKVKLLSSTSPSTFIGVAWVNY